jgi:hypothetical protein
MAPPAARREPTCCLSAPRRAAVQRQSRRLQQKQRRAPRAEATQAQLSAWQRLPAPTQRPWSLARRAQRPSGFWPPARERQCVAPVSRCKAGGIACASAPAAPRPRPRQVAAPPAAAARGCACALAPATVRRAARPAAGRRTGRLSLARHAARLARHRTRLRPAQRGERLLHRCATRAPGRAASAAVDARSRRERALAPAFARTFESLLRISAPRLVRV